MKDKTFKLVSKSLITLAVIYWGVLLLSVLTGCKTMQSPIINLKEPISSGGDWIMERKDFKVYKDPMETTIYLDEPLGARDYWEREEFLQHFD
jgi:hypothetical protein